MASQLETLVDLRRNAEKAARDALDLAAAARVKEDEEQARLVARWQAAKGVLDAEKARWPDAPATAAQGLTREHYRRRLDDDVTWMARVAEGHRCRALAAAMSAEDEARVAYEEAHRATEAALKLKERADAEEARIADRRAEDAASDHAHAAFVRRRSE
jgi:hypothetical protein